MGNLFPKGDVRREFEDLKSDLNQGNIPEVAAEQLNKMQNLPLKIAVVGKAGAGKSSFINAFKNVEDEGAAEVGRVEGPKEPVAYPRLSFPYISELPAIRMYTAKTAEYFKEVQFEGYDIFTMVVTDRFTENDAFLAKEIQRMRKKFYYVRSKIDLSIESERRKRDFNEQKSLETIRNYCEDTLKKSAELSERVFLVSNLHADKYDFPRLRETMDAELPDYKKHILTLAAQVYSENNLRNKMIKMKPYIRKFAMVSGVCGAVPVVGFSLACDTVILMVALRCFWKVFGLDQRSLRFLALETGKEFEELKLGIQKRPLVKIISAQLVLSLLMKSVVYLMPSSVKNLRMGIGGVSSFCCMYYFLNKVPYHVMANARNVQTNFLK